MPDTQCQKCKRIRFDERMMKARSDGASAGSQCSAHVFKRAGRHLKRTHLARSKWHNWKKSAFYGQPFSHLILIY